MIKENDEQQRRKEFVEGYRDGFRSIQGNVVTPVAPNVVLEAGSNPFEQGYAYGVKDAGGK